MLVILAHPDDEVLGCGGTLLKAKDSGIVSEILFVGKGRPGGTQAEEAYRVADKAGWKILDIGDFPDQQFELVGVKAIAEWIRERVCFGGLAANTQHILTHSRHDYNMDHSIVHEAVMAVCRPGRGIGGNHEIWGVEIPGSARPDFTPTIYYDISSHAKRKFQLMDMYSETALAPPQRTSLGVIAHAIWCGSQVGFEKAERFELLRKTFTRTSGISS